MSNLEFDKFLNDILLPNLLQVIESSGITASEAEVVSKYLQIAVNENNSNMKETVSFKVYPKNLAK